MNELIIEECIGHGVCSSVWKACKKKTQTSSNTNNTANNNMMYYALKQFTLHSPQKRQMLIRELKLLCTLKCDTLITLHGAFLDDGDGGNSIWVCLEYMNLGSLDNNCFVGKTSTDNDNNNCCSSSSSTSNVDDRSDDKKVVILPEYAIAAMAYQILWGLSYLHFEGVLHRDIKVRMTRRRRRSTQSRRNEKRMKEGKTFFITQLFTSSHATIYLLFNLQNKHTITN